MRTDELIGLLAGVVRPSRGAVARVIGIALLAAIAGSFVVMLLGWGLRPDLRAALSTSAYWMKTVYTAAIALAGLVLVERLGRPGARARFGWLVAAAAFAIVVLLAAGELAALPQAQWTRDVMGQTWSRCPFRIAVIALPAFGATLWALRRMAPTRPRLAGAAAGLLAGGVGATVYGLYCQETAAAFTAVWYTLGMLVWAAIGAAFGGRLLRW
jgi:hypothetical protein